MASPAIGLVLLVFVCLVQAQNSYILQELSTPTNSSEDTDKRPPCVLINNYCGKIVPKTGMKKECCGDLVCYKNKCRRRTCC